MTHTENVLLVGGAGFIGSALTRALIKHTEYNIQVAYIGELSPKDKVGGAEYIQIDLSQKSEEAERVVTGASYVFLLAQPHIELIEAFLEYAKLATINKIVYTSTLLVYPDSLKVHTETEAVQPLTGYETKKCREEALLTDFAQQGIPVCIARLGNVYGDKKNRGIVNLVIRALQEREEFTINGDGEHVRDYIYIDDVTRALLTLLQHSQSVPADIYNVCTKQGTTINQLIAHLEKLVGSTLPVVHASPVEEKRTNIGDNAKLQALGWVPEYMIEQGLNRAYTNFIS